MKTLRKLAAGFSYLTWIYFNLAGIYALGCEMYELFTTEDVSKIIGLSAIGLVMIGLLLALSYITFRLIASTFGPKYLDQWLDKLEETQV
jgi:hypothetical protein